MKKIVLAISFLLVSSIAIKAQITVSLVKNINFGASSSSPRTMVNYNGYIYFTADDGIHGAELWRTDGTEQGTALVKDIESGSEGSSIYNLTVFNGKLYFSATTTEYGNELWISDGTSVGTTLFKDIHSNGSSQPQQFVVFNNRLFFIANDGSHGQELWSTDGTEAGTELFMDINAGLTGSNIYSTAVLGNHLYFSASSNTTGTELWRTDGTTSGTGIFLDINPGTYSSSPRSFKTIGNKMYFLASTNTQGSEPWVTDGTVEGTVFLYDVYDGYEGNSSVEFVEYNGSVYFGGREGTNTAALFVTNGEPSGTSRILTQNGISYAPAFFAVYDGKMFFRWGTQTLGTQLFVSDGTTAGTVPYSSSGITAMMNSATSLLVFENKLFLGVKFDDSIGQELYVLSAPMVSLMGDILEGPICPQSEVEIVAHNAEKYAFYLNDNLVQALSSSNEWVANNLNNNDKITVHGFNSSNQLVGKDSVIVQVVNINSQVTLNGTILEAVEQAGATYLWSGCDGTTLTGTHTGYALNMTQTGSVQVTVTKDGCTVTSPCTLVTVESNGENPGVGIEEVDAHVFSVYPNPTSGTVTIDFANEAKSGIVRVTDLTGKEINAINFDNVNNVAVELTGEAGMYILTIQTGNGTTVKTVNFK